MALDDSPSREQAQAPNAFNQLPPIASIWRRIGAFFVDSILLGIMGQIIGLALVFASLAFQLGPYGRFIGLVIILIYFGTLNSAIGNGRTLGKRLLKIAVRKENGGPINFGRSLIRAAILFLPFILNGWPLPASLFPSNIVPIVIALTTVIFFGIGAALVYTVIFNRKTRQGFHDLICKTYVVKLSGSPISAFPKTARIHWIISGILIALPLVLISLGAFVRPTDVLGSDFAQLQSLQQTLSTDNRLFGVSVLDQRVSSISSNRQLSLRILNIEAWYKGLPTQEQRIETMNSIAKAILENFTGIDQFDRLRIGILSKYDLGIAEGHILAGDIEPIDVWRQRLSK